MSADESIATPQEMLSALERWASAKGWLRERRRGGKGWADSGGEPWDLAIEGDRVWIGGRRPYSEHTVTPEIAIAWALTVEAGLEAVDLGPCSLCQGTGSFWWDGEDCHPPGVVACPDCDATGRIRRYPARLVLDADPVGREHLSVIADRLSTRGETLGHVLSLALNRETIGDERDTRVGVEALTRAWERLTVPCERCEETGRVTRYLSPFGYPTTELPGPGLRSQAIDCPDCNGHGRVKPVEATVSASELLGGTAPDLRFAQEYECIPAPPEPPEETCVLCGEPIREGQATHAQVAHWGCAQEHRRRRDSGVPAVLATSPRTSRGRR